MKKMFGKRSATTAIILGLILALTMGAIPALALEDTPAEGAEETAAVETETETEELQDPDAPEVPGDDVGDTGEIEDEENEGQAGVEELLPDEALPAADDGQTLAEEPEVIDTVETAPDTTVATGQEPEQVPQAAMVAPTGGPLVRGAAQQLWGTAEITGAKTTIDGVELQAGAPINITQSSLVVLKWDFEVKSTDTINAGDYEIFTTHTWPTGIPLLSGMNGMVIPIQDEGTENEIGTISFMAGGGLKITYSAGIIGMSDVTGSFTVTSYIDFSQITVPGDTVNIIMRDDGTYEFEAIAAERTAISKRVVDSTLDIGEATPLSTPHKFDTIVWEIDVNTKLDPLTSATVVDTLSQTYSWGGTGLLGMHHFKNTIDVKVYELSLNAYGQFEASATPLARINSGAVTPGVNYKVTRNSDQQATIELGAIGEKAYRIVLESHVDLLKLTKNYDHQRFYNTAVLNGTASAQDDIPLAVPALASKAGKYDTDLSKNGDHYITWWLYINLFELNYGNNGNNVVVTDQLPPGLEFVKTNAAAAAPFDFYLVEHRYDPALGKNVEGDWVYNYGQAEKCNQATLDKYFNNITLSGDKRTAQFDFQTINTAWIIRVPTKIVDQDAYDQFLREGYSNTMFYQPGNDEFLRNADTVVAPSGVSNVTLKKEHLEDEMTYDTMRWRITYSIQEGRTANDITVTDTLQRPDASYDMRFLEDTLKVTYTPSGSTQAQELEEGTDYQLTVQNTPVLGSTSKIDGFVLAMNSSLTGGELVLEFDTSYKLASDGLGLGGARGNTFYNNATVSAILGSDSAPTSRTVQATAKVPDRYSINGLKSGEYGDGDVITWTVDLNYRHADLGENVVFTDTLGSNQRFTSNDLADNLKVYKVTDSGDVLLALGTEYTIDAYNYLTGFTLTFADMGTDHYRLVYTSQVRDTNTPLAEYINTGEVTAPERGGGSYTFTASVSKPSDSTLLKKDIGSTDGNLWHWSIVVNAAREELKDIVVTDRLSPGLVLNEKSVVIKNITNKQNTVIDPKNYKVEVTPPSANGHYYTEMVITFLDTGSFNPTDKILEIIYDTTLDVDTAKQDDAKENWYIVSNEVTLTAGKIEVWDTVDNSTVITGGAGVGSGKKTARFQILKVDGDTEKWLTGAKFDLFDSDGKLVQSGIETTNGFSDTIVVEKGHYTLVETHAPDGYALPEGDAAKTELDLTRDGKIDVEIEIENWEEEPDPDPDPGPNPDPDPSGKPDPSPGPDPSAKPDPSSKPVPSSEPTTTRPATTGPATTSRPGITEPSSAGSSSSSSRRRTPAPDPTPETSAPAVVVPITPVPSSSTPPSTSRRSSSTSPAPVFSAPLPVASVEQGDSSEAPMLSGVIVPNEGEGGGPGAEDLTLAGIPLGGLGEGAAWSLLNLMMSVLSILTALVLFISMLRRRKLNEEQEEDEDGEPMLATAADEEDEPEEVRNRLTALRLPAMFLGALPGILFLVLENTRLPMTWITQWTPIIGAAFIVHMAFVILHFAIKKRAKNAQPEEEQAVYS